MKLLLEMRPALDGHAGIPQETRLLFRGLSLLDGLQVDGLLQSSNRIIARGLPAAEAAQVRLSVDERIHHQARVVIDLRPGGSQRRGERWVYRLRSLWTPAAMLWRALLGRPEPLGRFQAPVFSDFVWREIFSRTLPVEDHALVTQAHFRVLRVPWNALHLAGLWSRRLGRALYPRLDTQGYALMVAETPFPGRVRRGTRMIVRYHDAIPLLMPHTITDKAFHQAAHYRALKLNVESGAWFACVSEATRRDLVSIFPEVAARAVTIPNMVSHHYHAAPEGSPARLQEIVRTRRNPRLKTARFESAHWPLPDAEYLLMVSTIEPRKNHLTLLAAWEQLRAEHHTELKLVIVGGLGWDHEPIVARFEPWLQRGEAHFLADVPADELRLLYQGARATVCPSFGEGFDFSGVEAMRCGGAVVASDIPVHRDVFATAAEYFNTYSAPDLRAALWRVINGNDPAAVERRAALVRAGDEVAARYLPEQVLPQWQAFLERVASAP